MKASETKLQPVIEGTKQYVVPLFQRTYSWDTKEWEALWDDLVEIIEEGNGRSHFVGSIVTMPTQSVPEGVAKYLLIDGQQRLTTLYVLLAALRDKVKDEPGTLANQIEDLLLMNRYQDGNDAFKLLPTQTDRDAFIRVMHGTWDGGSDQITRARKFFERKLRAADAPSTDVLRKTIVERLIVVSIVLERDDNPHLIFESLNAKGRPLSQADLIRNYFFMRIHVGQQESLYLSLWKPMQDELGDDLTEYIRHFLMKDGAVVKKGDVYFSLKLRADEMDADGVVAYLRDIRKAAAHYAKLLHPDQETSRKLRDRLHRLKRIEITVAYPFLLNLYADYAAGQLSEDEFAEVLDVLENFLIRRFVCAIPTTGLNRIFPLLYFQAIQAPSLADGVRDALRTRNYPRDGEFRDRFVSSKLYGSGDRIDKTKLVLERLEASFGHKEVVPFDQLTIEHVMPQTLTDWWRTHLGEQWAILYETLLDTIGNLTLTAYNSPLSNEDWEHKRAILRDSHLELNDYFGACPRWDEDAIRARAEYLATRALEIWKYFGTDKDGLSSQRQSVTGRTPAAVVIYGQRIPVSTWRDVAQQTMETIATLDEERFWKIVDRFPRLLSKDPSRFRSRRELSNGVFVETHLSADAIYRFCLQATELVDMTADDWDIEFQE